jgi:hypothetical protein
MRFTVIGRMVWASGAIVMLIFLAAETRMQIVIQIPGAPLWMAHALMESRFSPANPISQWKTLKFFNSVSKHLSRVSVSTPKIGPNRVISIRKPIRHSERRK